MCGRGDPKITIGIKGLRKILGQDTGLKNSIGVPLTYWATTIIRRQSLLQSPLTSHFGHCCHGLRLIKNLLLPSVVYP